MRVDRKCEVEQKTGYMHQELKRWQDKTDNGYQHDTPATHKCGRIMPQIMLKQTPFSRLEKGPYYLRISWSESETALQTQMRLERLIYLQTYSVF